MFVFLNSEINTVSVHWGFAKRSHLDLWICLFSGIVQQTKKEPSKQSESQGQKVSGRDLLKRSQ